MDLQKLSCFVAVADELHFGRAARRLYVTPSAVSVAVRTLEHQLELTLFERTSRRVELTEAGRALLPQARELVAMHRGLQEAVRRERDRQHHDAFTIGLLDEGAAELTGPIVAAFRAARPELAVRLRHLRYGPHLSALQTGQVDAVLGPRLAFPPDRVRSRPLFADGRLAALPVTDPLADAEHVPGAALLGLPVPRLDGVPQRMVDHFLLAKLRGGASLRTTPGQSVMSDVMHQVALEGAAITVTRATARFHSHPGVAYRPVLDVSRTITSAVVRPGEHGRDSDRLVDDLLRVAAETAHHHVGLVAGACLVR